MAVALNIRAGQTQVHVRPPQRALGGQREGERRAQHGQHIPGLFRALCGFCRNGGRVRRRTLQIDVQTQVQRAVRPVFPAAVPLPLPCGRHTARRQIQVGQGQPRRGRRAGFPCGRPACKGQVQAGFGTQQVRRQSVHMEHRLPQDRFQAAVHGQARPRFHCVARPFVRPLIRPGRWSGLGFQADFRRRATEHGHGKRRFLRPAQARPDVQLRALSPGREPGVQIGPQGLRCGSRSRRVSSFPLRRLCFCRVRRWRRRRAAQQFRRQQGVFHAQRVQMHRGQPTGQVIQNARRVAEHHAQALHGQGRLRDGRLRGGRQIGQTTQCRIGAADGRNTHSAGQGMPVPGKAVFRSRKPDALGVGGFQAEGAGKGQRAGEVGQAHMQAAFPQGAFQSGIDGFCQPGLAAFTAQHPGHSPQRRQQQHQQNGQRAAQPARPPFGMPGASAVPVLHGGRRLRRGARRPLFLYPRHQKDCPMLI